jgi:hypothetical protein
LKDHDLPALIVARHNLLTISGFSECYC